MIPNTNIHNKLYVTWTCGRFAGESFQLYFDGEKWFHDDVNMDEYGITVDDTLYAYDECDRSYQLDHDLVCLEVVYGNKGLLITE